MPLPFLKNKDKSVAGLIISHRTPDKERNEEENQDDSDAGIHAAAKDLIDAVHSQDVKAVAQALRAAFQIMEMEPHEEADHDEDFESQNMKAAE